MIRLSILCLTLLLTACVTTKQLTNNLAIGMVSSGDFQFIKPATRTYAWHPNSGQSYVDENDINKKTLKHMFNDVIEQTLSQKGYIRVELEQLPDFIVGYGVAVESSLSDNEIFEKTQLATGIPAEDFHDKNEKGTIVIAMYNYPLMELQWKILAQSGASPEWDIEHRELQIKEYVDRMLQPMPPRH